MKNLLILDTETSGLSHQHDKMLEVAAIMFCVETKSILQQCSTLLQTDENKAYHINKISVDTLKNVRLNLQTISIELIAQMIDQCDAIIAHNADFDKRFVATDPILSRVSSKTKWFCSKKDISWPKSDSLKLVDIARAMEVETAGAHRALADCIMLANCLTKLPDLKAQLTNQEERKLYKATIGYEDRHIAKDAGFYFNPNMRRWEKMLTAKEASLINFSISQA